MSGGTSHKKYDLELLRLSAPTFSVRRDLLNRRVASPQYDTRQLYAELPLFRPNSWS
jgi:hypothetical protein